MVYFYNLFSIYIGMVYYLKKLDANYATDVHIVFFLSRRVDNNYFIHHINHGKLYNNVSVLSVVKIQRAALNVIF